MGGLPVQRGEQVLGRDPPAADVVGQDRGLVAVQRLPHRIGLLHQWQERNRAASLPLALSGQDDILRNVINSLIVGVPTAAITAVVATLAGYGFAMFRFRGSGFVILLVGVVWSGVLQLVVAALP